jgi:hypothetical protein
MNLLHFREPQGEYPTMNNEVIDKAIRILSRESPGSASPSGRVARDHDPFKVLVSTMLSLRTKEAPRRRPASRCSHCLDPEGILGLRWYHEKAISRWASTRPRRRASARHPP